MQDNAPIHKSKVVMDFLAANGIPTLRWPPQSPDLNPIENIWGRVKQDRFIKFPPPSSKKTLIDQMLELWNNYDENKRETLSRSLPKRLLEVKNNKGFHTKY